MAIIVDRMSDYKGEQKVRNAFEQYLSNDVVVYNNREVNGREYDICLLVKNISVFIIEVKGWLSDKIKVYGVDDIEVEGYSERQRSPKKQAKSYCIQYLDRLKKRYKARPLVIDLVAYPFIAKEQYYASHLNIISEEQFTLLEEDLQDAEKLKAKLYMAYTAKKAIPHAELSEELIDRIRRDEEPGFVDADGKNSSQAYSEFHVFPKGIDEGTMDYVIHSYFRGTKEIICISDRGSFDKLIYKLDRAFKSENIEPGLKLSIGYKNGIKTTNTSCSYKIFNFEIYLLSGLSDHCVKQLCIEDGKSASQESLLMWISENSSFNVQQYIVEHASTEKNTLVEAGAGTGKTYSMVSRVAYLCNKKNGVIRELESELAMVTFTNDAANNMKVRLKQMFLNYFILTGDEYYLRYVESVDRANISTIHKFALQILRGASFNTGLGKDFRISSDEYNRGKIYDLYLSAFLKKMEEENPNFIREIPVSIYDLKKKIIGIADRLLQKSVNLSAIKPEEMGVPVFNTLPYFNDIITTVILPAEIDYAEALNNRNALDLKDCIILLNKVLEQEASNISHLKYQHIFVDEFQDTDDVQIEVFQKIQKKITCDCRLFVVGDLKQSIYRFRGASLSAFSQLQRYKRYAWAIHHLNRNYRTDRRLLDLYDDIFDQMGKNGYLPYEKQADRLIGDKEFTTKESELLQCIPCHGKDEEKFFDALFDAINTQIGKIDQMLVQGKKLSIEERTVAILVRSNWQIEKIIEESKKRQVHIDVKSGGDLFQLASTLDLYKLLLAIENSTNPVYLVNFMESNYVDMKLDYQELHGMASSEKLRCIQDLLESFFTRKTGKGWKETLDEVFSQPILYALKKIYVSLEPWKQYSNNLSEQEHYIVNYDYLLEKIVKFSRIDALTINQITKYLEINIVTRQQELARVAETDEGGCRVLCTTVHKSKGLEYGTVILPYTDGEIGDIRRVKTEAAYSNSKLSYTVLFRNWVREQNSNYSETTEKEEQIAEESRILYVALTRAIRNCVWIMNLDKKVPISWGTLMGE